MDSKDIFPENKMVQRSDFSKVDVIRLQNGFYRKPRWESFYNVRIQTCGFSKINFSWALVQLTQPSLHEPNLPQDIHNLSIFPQGTEVHQMLNSDPSLLLAQDSLSDVEFTGTFYVATTKDDDYIGLVFNYQSNRRFILVSWKQRSQTYGRSGPLGRAGLQVHLVNSRTGPSRNLIRALWATGSTNDQVRMWPHPLD